MEFMHEGELYQSVDSPKCEWTDVYKDGTLVRIITVEDVLESKYGWPWQRDAFVESWMAAKQQR